jgi:2-methylisocitrate lyase-like PEP mutase family enzyme
VSRAKASQLRALHVPGDPLVVVNVWDAASARTVAAAAGCRALATASWSIAAAHGVDDHEVLGVEAMVAAVGRVANAVELPVSADLERGYGDAAATCAAAWDAGAVGANLEDGLVPAAEHAAAVAAVRERLPDFVINARTDEYLLGGGDPGAALDRGRAYLDAGADCIFVPGLHDLDEIRSLAAELPLSLLAGPRSPPLRELAAAGVARISFGPGPMGAAYAALGEAAVALLALGEYPPELAHRP